MIYSEGLSQFLKLKRIVMGQFEGHSKNVEYNPLIYRFGASPVPMDDGIPPILALLDKLLEYEDHRYPYQLEACLKLLMRATDFVELPYKVRTKTLC